MSVTTYKIAASGACPTGARSEIRAGRNRLIIDEPVERGGTDLGTSPLETLVAALLGCTNVVSHRIATEMGVRLELVSVEAVAMLDGRALKGEAAPVVFPEIRLDIDVRTDASEAQLGELRARLARRCPVARMLRDAGTQIVDRWRVIDSPVQAARAS